ncbi:MAG: RidA family protein [Alphaproteobacteria bacterium]|nr:RidA family protein [Alphaproteobacteria bacterium]
MLRKNIFSGSQFEDQINFCRAVVVGNTIYVSGTTGFDYSTMAISDSIIDQTEQCFKNIKNALKEADAVLDDIVQILYILPDKSLFSQCWPILKKYLGNNKPAATFISAGLVDYRMKIEIQVVAVKTKS